MRSRNRAGVTLIELIAAIGVAGLAVLGALLLMRTATDTAARIAEDRERIANAGVGNALMHDLLAGVETTDDSARRFQGNIREVRFPTQCATSRGWTRRCNVRLAVDSLLDSGSVVAQFPDGTEAVLNRFPGSIGFRFLDLSAEAPVLRDRWTSEVNPPSALLVLSSRDTTFFTVGPGR